MALWRHIFHIIDTGSDSHENMSIYTHIFMVNTCSHLFLNVRYLPDPVFVEIRT